MVLSLNTAESIGDAKILIQEEFLNGKLIALYLIKIRVAVERCGDYGIRGIVKVSETPHRY
jgi:hypothetical protein